MKKAIILLVSLFAMMAASTGLKAQEVTILLRPGWNWIGYPYAESVDLETAFGDFEPMTADVIKSYWGYSEYATGDGWLGDIDELQPGWGYMYYSNRTEAVNVVLNAPASQTMVTTSEPTSITAESAVVGGTVTVPEGTHVFLRGVCWGTEPNPDIDGSHTKETGIGSFSSTLVGLSPNTTYYVRAYAVSDHGLDYGNEVSFTTEDEGYYAYVDLGLPSGLLWATCNVGAYSPDDYGDYFAWGETQPKDTYNWSTYQHSNGNSYNKLTKYCNDSYYGYNGFTDTLTILLPEDDAATTNWGSDWRTPTIEDWFELYQNTTQTWATHNGVNGMLFTASNGNSFFLPAAGKCYDSSFISVGDNGNYWSSSLYTNPCDAHVIFMFETGFGLTGTFRSHGQPVRAVRSPLPSNVPTGAINGKFTVNEDGDQVYFSQGNLQYIGSAETPYWKFADNQWDYFGDNGQGSARQNVDRDLFSWGTSGYDHGAICYQPWSTSQTNSEYNVYGGYTYNLYDQTGQADWGYNPISNGGNQENQWRTLTHEEWDCVFNTRSTTSGIRYAKANVNDVNGVILLPDGWSSDTYSLSNTNSSGSSYSSNVITISQWSVLEQAGAVFLPAACNRNGTSVVGIDGDYWTASYYSSNTAWSVSFNNGASLITNIIFGRYFGFSVRLVTPAEN